MRKYILFLFITIIPYFINNALAADALYVGHSITLSAPNPPFGAAINQTAWGSSSPYLIVQKSGTYGAKVTVKSYFSGSAPVQCDYYYYRYINGRPVTNHATTYFYITCKPVNLTVSSSSLDLTVGEGQQLSYTYSPSNISPAPSVRYYSSNSNVANVNSNGYVQAVGSGSARITLENSAGPDVYCSVSVRALPPTGVTLPSYTSLIIGRSTTLTPTLIPYGASSTFSWHSDDNSIATVTSYGKVTGTGIGTTNIWVTTDIGGYNAYCTVSVRELPPPPSDISVREKMILYPGFSYTIIPQLDPENAETTYTWRSDNTSVATVNYIGVVTAKNQGVANITVTTQNGLSAVCETIVDKLPAELNESSIRNKISRIERIINNTFYDVY